MAREFGTWYDSFKDEVGTGIIKRQNPNYSGWKAPTWFMEQQIERYLDKEKELGEKLEYVFIVTNESGAIVDPTKYRLWIRGFRSYESFCEDFPPINFP